MDILTKEGRSDVSNVVENPASNNPALREPIAIIGVGCRFPGGVNSPESFWRLLRDEVDAITEMPPGRFDIDEYYDPTPATPGKIITREGGFLNDIDQFDALFFGISPREANYLDPQQRLLLEVAWEALEDAGQAREKLAGSRTGVFIGMWLNDYEAKMYDAIDDVSLYVTTGGGRYPAAGRLSYTFDFRGPSVTVDTACSSSLVSVHMACQALWSGEATMALAGGVNLILEPQISIAYSHSKMLAPDGRCKFGDARANGYVRSDGAGLIVLKPLAQALADGDPIYALIRGSVVNNDGRSSNELVAPGVDTQAEMLRQAYRNANVSPNQVDYVEAHGTGTHVGDPVEIKAIGLVVGENRPADRPCYLGSVKTNIGHTEGAAGVAGLIKVALSLKHRAIPASLHFQQPNPNIPWDELPVQIHSRYARWPEGSGPALAGVSAFGITGTNAHVVLQAAPIAPEPADSIPDRARLIPLSAHTADALRTVAQDYAALADDEQRNSLAELGHWTAVRRAHHAHRLAVVVRDRHELSARLGAFLRGEPDAGLVSGQPAGERRHKVAFIFPGQGSQWFGMGRQLLANEPVFRQTLEACERAMRPFVDWSLAEQLSLDENDAGYRLNEIDVIQPVLLSIEIALAELWRSWGVEPDAVIGHSMGEVGAAAIAGALSLDDAMRVICHRSRLMRRTSGQGAMAVVELSRDEAQAALAGYEDRLAVAVSNSPRSTVLSGDPAALNELIEALQQRDVFCRLVKVDVASHSPQMDPLKAELQASLEDLRPRTGNLPIYSTALGRVIDGAGCDAAYWVQNIRQPVMFSDMVQQLLADDCDIFIEMSPHPVLLAAVQQVGQFVDQECLAVPSLRRNEDEPATMLASLGQLYTAGYPVDWERLYPAGGRPVKLPLYPWQRERFWFEATPARKPPAAGWPGAHPLLSRYLPSATGAHIWETTLTTEAYPYLRDHRVRGEMVLPAAAYVEMALAAASEAAGGAAYALENVVFKEALFLDDDRPVTLQLLLAPDAPGTLSFQVFSRADTLDWTLHATGLIRLNQTVPRSFDGASGSPGADAVPGALHYQAMQQRQLEYGPAFQGVVRVRREDDAVRAELKLPPAVGTDSRGYQLHPALLDACFQLVVALAGEEEPAATYLPVGLDSLTLVRQPTEFEHLTGVAVRRPAGAAVVGDVFLMDADGQVLAAARGLSLKRLEGGSPSGAGYSFYQTQWQPQPLAERPAGLSSAHAGSWLIFADDRGAAKALAGRLQASGESCALVMAGEAYQTLAGHNGGSATFQLNPSRPEEFHQLVRDISPTGHPLRGIVHMWSLDAGDDRPAAQERGSLSVMHLVQALSQAELAQPPRLWLVTRGVVYPDPVAGAPDPQIAAANVAQSPLWGLGGVIALEHPELRCTRVDLSPLAHEEESVALWAELLSGEDEDQLALRMAGRYVARLADANLSETASISRSEPGPAKPDQGYQLTIPAPGILDDLILEARPRRQPQPGEIEIAVRAAGLNFLDVMKVLGIYPGIDPSAPPAIGAECAGRVTAVGEGVTEFQVGDDVIAITPSLNKEGLFTAYATLPAQMVVAKPAHFSHAEAATLPIAFLTAHYALNHLGRMTAGERVLIHSATGGVGLAAVQLAQRAGAEVFATAGSPEKRDYLRGLGIRHVMDSRSLDFAAEIMDKTDGRGVDLVLNSLSGEAIRQSLAALAPYGRFLEIGKRDIYQNSPLGLEPFKKNLSFFAIDLARIVEDRPALVMSLLREVMASIDSGDLHPLPTRLFPIEEAAGAFRTMAQAKHVGKIAVTFPTPESSEARLPLIYDDKLAPQPIAADATYLITGGLGGLGLLVAGWLAQKGARHIVLLGRSEPKAEARAAITALETTGAKVVVARADVTQAEQVAAVLAQIRETLPPLRGVVHAAGLLADSTLLQLDRRRLFEALAPKVDGAWNLHTLTAPDELDFFVLFSSVASLLGSPGQANYAAGNAFLDSLAHLRRAAGLPALSINWGPWSEIGLAAAESNRGDRLAQRGVGSITPSQGIAALEKLLGHSVAQAAVMPFDPQQWCEANLPAANSSLLKDRIAAHEPAAPDKAQPEEDIRARLLAADPGRPRRLLLESHLREQIAHVLRLSPSRIESHQPLKSLGLDSLMAVELRNRLEATLGVSLSATLVFNYPTVTVMAPHVADKMGIPLETETAGEAAQAPAPSKQPAQKSAPQVDNALTSAEIGQLSDEAAEALLLKELEDIDF